MFALFSFSYMHVSWYHAFLTLMLLFAAAFCSCYALVQHAATASCCCLLWLLGGVAWWWCLGVLPGGVAQWSCLMAPFGDNSTCK